MMRVTLLIVCILSGAISFGQSIAQKLEQAFTKLEVDEQFKNGTLAMYVKEAGSGNVVFEKNAGTGLAPASCQKVITSISSYELLGKDFRYRTSVRIEGALKNGVLNGNIIVLGTGDPTMGSWRWRATSMTFQLGQIAAALRKLNIRAIQGSIKILTPGYSYQPLPDGWIWQDIGNYYGAAAWGLNWHENQYDLHLQAGDESGAPTTILRTTPFDIYANFTNLITTGEKGSGDNGYIYSTPYNNNIFTTGTIPAGEKDFTISGSLFNPPELFAKQLIAYIRQAGVAVKDSMVVLNGSNAREIVMLESPPLDSINYWFLKKSVNIYGEALLKTIGKQEAGASTVDGIAAVKTLAQRIGLPKAELNIMDGSGLSPANRISCNALVSVLLFAKGQPWYSSFYAALPEMNGIKMKDGYISGVRSYTGFVKSRTGTEYCFAFIVNNFDGNAGMVREKMWKVLDLLKQQE